MKVQLHHYYKCTGNSIILQSWIPALPSSSLEKNRRGVCWPNFLTRMRWSVKARASGPLASQLPDLAEGSISSAAAHCYGWPLMQRMAIDAEACLAPYEGHQVVEALTAGKKTLKLLHLLDHLISSSTEFFSGKKLHTGAEIRTHLFTHCMWW